MGGWEGGRVWEGAGGWKNLPVQYVLLSGALHIVAERTQNESFAALTRLRVPSKTRDRFAQRLRACVRTEPL